MSRGRPTRQIKLTDPAFDTIHRLAVAREHSRTRCTREVLLHPRRSAAAAGVLWALPRQTLEMAAGPASHELLGSIRGTRKKRLWPFTVVPILTIPPPGQRYLSGRSRQALRTNVTKAAAAGVTCGQVTAAQFAGLVRDLAAVRFWIESGELPGLVHGVAAADHRLFFVARQEGRPAVIAKVVVDDRWARLDMFVRDPTVAGSSEARYALMSEIVTHLQQRRVTALLVTNALELDAGVRFYSHLVGFVPVNVRVARVGLQTPR